MFSLQTFQTELKDNLAEVRRFFIDKYIPADPSHTPALYQHDVKAYCILAHAIFEEFVEQLSLEVMKHSTSEWLSKRQLSDAIVTLCLSYNASLKIQDDEDEIQTRSFDAIRHSVDEAKTAHSKVIFSNQGFSLRYLRKLLVPIAIDVTSDAKFTNSLRVLADARRSYAHKSAKAALFTDRAKASKPMPPETARDIVEDCLELCIRLSNDASKYLPPEPQPALPLVVQPAANAPVA